MTPTSRKILEDQVAALEADAQRISAGIAGHEQEIAKAQQTLDATNVRLKEVEADLGRDKAEIAAAIELKQ